MKTLTIILLLCFTVLIVKPDNDPQPQDSTKQFQMVEFKHKFDSVHCNLKSFSLPEVDRYQMRMDSLINELKK